MTFLTYHRIIRQTITCLSLALAAKAQTNPNVATKLRATVQQEGFAVGYDDTLKAAGKPFWFEASAILYDGKSVLVAHDKPMPDGQASVGSWSSPAAFYGQQTPTYFTGGLYKKGIKYEEMAQSPDRKWIFLTTAFDRVKEGSTDWDAYNMLMCWPAGKPSRAHLLGASAVGDTIAGTSVALRERFSSVLALSDINYYGVVRYFKIEGLAATNDRLFIGIREEGNSYQDFKPVVRLLTIRYEVVGRGAEQHVELVGDFNVLASIDMTKQVTERLPANLALSSIEFDPVRNLFWVITTYESGDSIGAYLWTANEDDLIAGRMKLIRTPTNEPLLLTHKAEDMTFLNAKTLLLISDDDRIPTRVNESVRKPNQAAYTVLSIE